ncbi:GntR family transcriptional regulator [Bradyrhizobium sp. CCBAU 51753]|uniref:GntR family transcriptional regulator n=1 Tax=Bradyrhizobium sp. CCBAU 51753 TaxID=1325100 RepID=UPI00188A7F1C|nr:GntR family transcriptional regulator [Bradyrhizobium sp. CCBAU 51753]QOZ23907.1 GntR family transcriptional regulator [Bradyrhizobium sp. CCBAU 51753]
MLNDTDIATPLIPIDRQASLGELAYSSLKDSIISGQFVPGRKLTVRSVAQALGVSTTPVRDAIVRLVAEGALVNLGPKTVVVPVLTIATLDEVTKIRLALEGLAAFEGAAHIKDRDISFLEEAQNRLTDAMDKAQYTDVLRANKAFHFRLYAASEMPRLVTLIESQWLRIGPSMNDLYPEFAIHRRGVTNHQRVISGLKRRDGTVVRTAIEKDVHDGYQRLSKLVLSRRQEAASP